MYLMKLLCAISHERSLPSHFIDRKTARTDELLIRKFNTSDITFSFVLK